MKVNWITLADERVASYRYHAMIPARELQLLGHTVSITPQPVIDADRYIFSKHFNEGEYWSLLGLRAAGKKTYFHCCDNHFEGTKAAHYRRMIEDAGEIICTTHIMAEVIREETDRYSTVIPDPYEMTEKEPCYSYDGKTMKALWFGHPVNIEGLSKVLPLPENTELRMVTNLITPDGKQLRLGLAFDKIPWTPWSIGNMTAALEWSDCVIIPVKDNLKNRCRSHNRLIESVRRGKFVIATEMPSYKEYGKWMYLGDIHKGIEWLKSQSRDEIELRIAECQEYIRDNYNPRKIGEMWQKALQ